MNNDNLEETKRLNKQSSDRKNANNTTDTQPDKNKDINGISKSAMSTMSSGSNNRNFKIDK